MNTFMTVLMLWVFVSIVISFIVCIIKKDEFGDKQGTYFGITFLSPVLSVVWLLVKLYNVLKFEKVENGTCEK